MRSFIRHTHTHTHITSQVIWIWMTLSLPPHWKIPKNRCVWINSYCLLASISMALLWFAVLFIHIFADISISRTLLFFFSSSSPTHTRSVKFSCFCSPVDQNSVSRRLFFYDFVFINTLTMDSNIFRKKTKLFGLQHNVWKHWLIWFCLLCTADGSLLFSLYLFFVSFSVTISFVRSSLSLSLSRDLSRSLTFSSPSH